MPCTNGAAGVSRSDRAVTRLPVLQRRFYRESARAEQWRAFLRRAGLELVPKEFDEVGELIRAFLDPIWDALRRGVVIDATWSPRGPWRNITLE